MRKEPMSVAPSGAACACLRCGAACKVAPVPGSTATMLKRGRTPKGLCVNCAVHDWLRNTYPANLLLARSGPKSLAHPHIQEQFAGLMTMAGSDARPDEIDWERIVANWDLPFPTKLKPSATNPVSQQELDREPQRYQRQLDFEKQQIEDPGKRKRELEQSLREVLKLVGSPNADKPMTIREDPGSVTVFVG